MVIVDDDVKQMVASEGRDYRVCTACMGPALVPTTVKSSKSSDLKFQCGNNILYVSAVQARHIDRVTLDMLYDQDDIDSCPVFYGHS